MSLSLSLSLTLRLDVPCPVNSALLFKKIYFLLYSCSLCPPPPCLRACLKPCVQCIKCLLHQNINVQRFFMWRDLARKGDCSTRHTFHRYYCKIFWFRLASTELSCEAAKRACIVILENKNSCKVLMVEKKNLHSCRL